MRRNNRRNFNVSVAYNVTAPGRRPHPRARPSPGSITAKDIQRRSVGASRSAARCGSSTAAGSPAAKSISGDVEVTETEIDGSLNASTASGSVMLRKVKARQVEARLDQRQRGARGRRCAAGRGADRQRQRAVRRSADAAAPATSSPRTPATSRVALGGNAGFEVEATSFSGSIRSDFSFGNSRRHRARTVAAVGPRRGGRRQRGPRTHHVLGQHRHRQALNSCLKPALDVGKFVPPCIDSGHHSRRKSAKLDCFPGTRLARHLARRASGMHIMPC